MRKEIGSLVLFYVRDKQIKADVVYARMGLCTSSRELFVTITFACAAILPMFTLARWPEALPILGFAALFTLMFTWNGRREGEIAIRRNGQQLDIRSDFAAANLKAGISLPLDSVVRVRVYAPRVSAPGGVTRLVLVTKTGSMELAVFDSGNSLDVENVLLMFEDFIRRNRNQWVNHLRFQGRPMCNLPV